MPELGRHHLRHAVYLELDAARRPLRVSEIAQRLEGRGITTRGRAVQAVSDALRADVRAGRVTRIGWGTYLARPVDARRLRYLRASVRDAMLGAIRSGSRTPP